MSEIRRVIGVRSTGGPGAGKRGPILLQTAAHESGDVMETDRATVRRAIREKLTAELRAEADHMRERGRFRFENAWLTQEEILTRNRARRWRSWARLLELIGLLLALCGVTFVLYKLLFLLA